MSVKIADTPRPDNIEQVYGSFIYNQKYYYQKCYYQKYFTVGWKNISQKNATEGSCYILFFMEKLFVRLSG